MLKINGKEYSDETIVKLHDKRMKEYLNFLKDPMVSIIVAKAKQ